MPKEAIPEPSRYFPPRSSWSPPPPPKPEPPPKIPTYHALSKLGPEVNLQILQDYDDEELHDLAPRRSERALEKVQYLLDVEQRGDPSLRDYRWSLVFKRAFWFLEHREQRAKRMKTRPLGEPHARLLAAALVADWYSWRYADAALKRRDDWPTEDVFLAQRRATRLDLNNARQQSRLHLWKHRYFMHDSDEVSRAVLKQAALQNVEDEQTLAPEKRNPSTIRTAAELVGAVGKTEVNIGNKSTTVNITLNPSSDEFKERAARVEDALRRLNAQEVPHEVVVSHLPQADAQVQPDPRRSAAEAGIAPAPGDRGAPERRERARLDDLHDRSRR